MENLIETQNNQTVLPKNLSIRDIRNAVIDGETWKPLVGYEKSYEISSAGRIRMIAKSIVTKTGQARDVVSKIVVSQTSDKGISYRLMQDGIVTRHLLSDLMSGVIVLKSSKAPKEPKIKVPKEPKIKSAQEVKPFEAKKEILAPKVFGMPKQPSKVSAAFAFAKMAASVISKPSVIPTGAEAYGFSIKDASIIDYLANAKGVEVGSFLRTIVKDALGI